MNHTERIERLLERVRSLEADAFVSERPVDIRYFTGNLDPRGLLVLRNDGEYVLVVPASAAEEARHIVQHVRIHVTPLGKHLSDSLPDLLPANGKLLLGEVSSATRAQLVEQGGGLSLEEGATLPLLVQREKSLPEMVAIRRAMAIAETGMQAAFGALKAGATELDVAAEATCAMLHAGAEALWFATQARAGMRSAFADAGASRRTLAAGEMGLIDVGPLYDGYAGDLTRSFVLGHHTPEQLRLLEATRDAQDFAISGVRAGVPAGELYQAVYAWFEERQMAGYFPHPLGHGLGLLGACPPWLRPDSDDRLEVGDILTLEPGLYVPGLGGCRIEDVVLVTETGSEPISTLSRMWEVDFSLPQTAMRKN